MNRGPVSRGARNRAASALAGRRGLVLLLRGAPGTGKSTVAPILAGELGGSPQAVVIEVDDLRGDTWRVGAAWNDEARHEIALVFASRLALTLLKASVRIVIVVDTFSSWGTAKIRAELGDRVDVHEVTLVVETEEHQRRLVTRPEVPWVFRDAIVARRMNDELRAERGNAIDATRVSPSEIAATIARLAQDAVVGRLTRVDGAVVAWDQE